ncbi:hypothetical protein SRB5_57040 [Streptomyces sp. RB5]|uniref:HTH cro/C1-type domain-containing protein n=1 Tax=Streptomyces smaragdinus TaxID=2585196 RepID=A0A7K0CR97_9ACTN|nr:helix-turn-helix transcriptional regulator [Streptomyces smaragdinus]MQY15522.1 hypothetical protein [Streptomyces smaragdinus]
MAEPEGEVLAGELYRLVGRQIKAARERAGLTQRELSELIGYSEELISSVERGRRVPQPEFLAAVDDALGCGGLLKAICGDVTAARDRARGRARHPVWFRDYARLEREATEIGFYSTLTVPGLLQTENYARTILLARQPLLDAETIEERVAARLARQQVLERWPLPMVTVVLDEAVLLRRIGGPEVQREQLECLLRIGALRNVQLQVLPLDYDGHAGMEGPFILIYPKGQPPVGYGEFQDFSQLVTDPDEVRVLAARYGSIRAQALAPAESHALIDRLRGEL